MQASVGIRSIKCTACRLSHGLHASLELGQLVQAGLQGEAGGRAAVLQLLVRRWAMRRGRGPARQRRRRLLNRAHKRAHLLVQFCRHHSQSVNNTIQATLRMIRCLTLIVTISTQHHMQPFPEKLGHNHKIILPEVLYPGGRPKES